MISLILVSWIPICAGGGEAFFTKPLDAKFEFLSVIIDYYYNSTVIGIPL